MSSALELRILHILRTLDPESGGPLSYLESVAHASREFRLTHFIAACRGDGPIPVGTREAYRPRSRVAGFASSGLARWLMRHAGEFDVAHVHGVFSYPLLVGANICRLRGVPYVVSTHGHLYAWSLTQRQRVKQLYLALAANRLMRGASSLVSTTDAETRVLAQRVPGIRTAQVPPCVPHIPVLPRAARGDGAALNIVFLGRLAPQKGLPILLEAIARLRDRGVEALLDIIGSGDPDYEDSLHQQCARLRITPHVSFKGFLEGSLKTAALAKADVFALPSNMENFSFATAEALAMGLPVVVSSEVGLAETVKRFGCGAVVPTGDAQALADALRPFQLGHIQVDASRRALTCAAAEFSPDRMGAALAQLYRQASDQG